MIRNSPHDSSKGSLQLIKKEWFIQSIKEPILCRYKFGQKLGQGAFGTVFKASLIGTDIIRAVKVIKKNDVIEPLRLVNQITFMKQLDHPNLVKLYETFESQVEIFLVMQFCEGGDLLDRIQSSEEIDQKSVKSIFRDMVKAINYLHSKGICHRDLKPENFLFLEKSKHSLVKLTDFGLSTMINSNKKMKSFVGTIYYISPQIVDKEYQISCDIWSLGIILIVLLTRAIPIEGREDYEIINNIKKNKILIPKNVSITARNLIRKCLDCPDKRIKASQILEHPWLIDQNQKNCHKLKIGKLQKFNQASRLKKIVLTIIASQVKSKDIQNITTIFKSLDVNNDGVLSVQEILNGLLKSRVQKDKKSLKQYRNIIAGLDTDKNGDISYTQFLAAMIDQQVYLKPNYLKIAFSIIDKDSSGTIELQQLKEIMAQGEAGSEVSKKKKKVAFSPQFNQSEWDIMMEKLDKNGDGKISFDQFITLFQE